MATAKKKKAPAKKKPDKQKVQYRIDKLRNLEREVNAAMGMTVSTDVRNHLQGSIARPYFGSDGLITEMILEMEASLK